MPFSSHQEIQILHVDDEPSITDLTGTFLEREDDRFAVQTATSADEGVVNINDRPPDCVVSDYNMPGTDGIEFLQAVREEYPDLPFILFTGKGSEAVASDAIAAGVTDYLQKGSGTERYELLANRIRNAVRTRRETERADRQEQLMRLTEFNGDTGGFELDTESNTVVLTAGTRRIIGRRNQHEMPLEEALKLFHPDDREDIQHTLDKVLETRKELYDTWRLQPGDGEERLLDMTITPVVENGGEVTKLRGAGHDITEREEHERTARQRQKQLSLFFEESPLGAVQWDSEFQFERMNGRAEEILGYSEAELCGESWEGIVAGDDRGQVGDAVEKLLDADGGTHVINRNVRKDGEVITCEWHNRVVTDADGDVQTIFSKFQDVTDRERRNTELEEYETIIEALSDAVYVLDEEGQFTYVNDELVELVGYDRETILGNTPSLIKDEEAVQRAEQELGRLLSSDGPEGVTFEVTVHPREGDPIVCEDHMGVLPYDGEEFNGSVGTLRDVTEQRESEAKLRQTTNQLQGVIDSVESAMWIRNTDHEYVYMNQHHRDLFDIADDTDIVGKQAVDLHSAEVAEKFQQNDERVYETREQVEIEEVIQTDDGRQYFLTRIVPLFDNGSVYATCGIATNITDQKEYEEKLQRQNERLEEFASIVSHDLRNPLRVADGRLELIRDECASDHIDGVAQALDRMDALIEDLLTLAREGSRVDEIEPIGLANVARNSWQTVKTRQATLDVDTSQVIEADRSRIQQLFENLYQNAIEHGGNDVTVSVGAIEDGFYVADTGPGIPGSDRENVFEAGYSTNESGTGFGLQIVKQITDAHGWEIIVTESKGGGARFEITGVEKGV